MLKVVEYLLEQPNICLNIRNNDRLTTFMLAMQVVIRITHHIDFTVLYRVFTFT
jgi:hypothetical protein